MTSFEDILELLPIQTEQYINNTVKEKNIYNMIDVYLGNYQVNEIDNNSYIIWNKNGNRFSNVKRREKLNKTQKKIIKEMVENPNKIYRIRELSDIIGITYSGIQRNLNILVENSYIYGADDNMYKFYSYSISFKNFFK